MPIYEYECGSCGDRHEFIQKFSEGPKRKCPSCGKPRLKKLVSAAAFHLKGSGWYVTDFRDKGKKKADGESGAGKKAEGKDGGEKKSESKGEGKSETKKESKAKGASAAAS